MVVIELRELQKRSTSSAVKFLKSRVHGEMEIHGSQVKIEDESPKKVKLLLRKFIHENRLMDYRVVSSNKDELTIVRIKQRSELSRDDRIRGVLPFSSTV